MFKLWKAIDDDKRLIKILYITISFLTLSNLMFWIGWLKAPEKLRVYIPPDLSKGVTLKPDHISKAEVYAFAFNMWQLMNSWPENGEIDYMKRIQSLRFYLTPHLYQHLQEDYINRKNNGELYRVRYLQGVHGSAYSEEFVKMVSHNSWEIKLPVRLVEWVKGMVVKDIQVNYEMRVVRVNNTLELNPWGLALDGFVHEPRRINKNRKISNENYLNSNDNI